MERIGNMIQYYFVNRHSQIHIDYSNYNYNKSSNISFYVSLVLPLPASNVLMDDVVVVVGDVVDFGFWKADLGWNFQQVLFSRLHLTLGSAPKNEAAGEG